MKSKQDRQRAAKLRKKKGPLTVEQRVWLASYDGTKSKSAAQRRPTTKATSPAKTATPPVVAGEQLAWGPPTPPPQGLGKIQATVPPVGSIDPAAHTWTPTMPEAPADAEPAPAGTPEQPEVGTPLVNDAPPSSGTPLGGDPHAAEQFAGIVMFITQIGIMNALEISVEMPIPAELRAFATTKNLTAYIEFVGESAKRVAIKYNFRGIPLADEAIVGGSVALSLLAWRANMKRKQAIAKATPANQVVDGTTPPPPPTTPPTAGVNALWDQR